MKKHRRSLTYLFLFVLSLALMLQGCVPADAPEEAMAAPPSYDTPAEVQRMRFMGEPNAGFGSTCGFGVAQATRLVFWPIVNFTDDGQDYAPGLAASWEPNEDFSTWTFNIDPRAVWSDGTPVTAGQIKRSWEIRYMPELQCGWGGAHFMMNAVVGEAEAWANAEPGVAPDIPGITAPDDHTLVVEFTRPKPQVFSRLNHPTMFLFKPEPVLENPDPSAFPETMIGAGPFMYQEYDTEAGTALLVRSPTWWGDVTPQIDEIEFTPHIADRGSRILAYLNDEFDFMGMEPGMWDQIKNTPSANDLLWDPTGGWYVLVIKSNKPPFDDINVRKAFIHAIDYDLVVETLLADAPAQLPVYQVLPPTFDCYQEKRPWTYDPELAVQELAQSKYGGPENLPAINVRYWQKDILPAKIAQLYQQMWSETLGVSVNLHQMGAWDAEFEKTVHLGRVSDGYSDLNPIEYLKSYGPSDGPVMCGVEGVEICESVCPECEEQREAYAHIDALVAQLDGLTPNDPNYCEAINAAEDAINEDFHYVPLFDQRRVFLIKPWIKNALVPRTGFFVTGLENIVYVAER